jgi:DNA (cytosine-5)-methyltransferase 1
VRVGSLFTGIGGLDLGLERAGIEIAWQCEIDPYCQQVLHKHWPEVKLYGDIRTVVDPEPVDLICGGFPCQPFSVAGKQRGKEDDRFLWPEMFRVIEAVRPTWVLGENVPGIINLALDDVLAQLEGLGYETATFIIPACAVDAKHRRDRVWIVAHATGDLRRAPGHEGHKPSDRCCADVANTNRERGLQPQGGIAELGGWPRHGGEDVSDSNLRRREQRISQVRSVSEPDAHGDVGDPNSQYAQGQRPNGVRLLQTRSGEGLSPRPGDGGERRSAQSRLGGVVDGLSSWLVGHWPPEPDIPRVAKGIPNRVARLKALGNAVVPAVAEALGRLIMEADAAF